MVSHNVNNACIGSSLWSGGVVEIVNLVAIQLVLYLSQLSYVEVTGWRTRVSKRRRVTKRTRVTKSTRVSVCNSGST